MTRKPAPKTAADTIRQLLKKLGMTLSQRQALELVARVEGFNSWQAMAAAPAVNPEAPAAETAYREALQKISSGWSMEGLEMQRIAQAALHANAEQTPEAGQDEATSAGDDRYQAIWDAVCPSLTARMHELAEGFGYAMSEAYELEGPSVEVNADEFRVVVLLRAKDESVERNIPMLAMLRLADSEHDQPDRYSLVLTVEDPYESTISASWNSSVQYGQFEYSATAEELLDRLGFLSMEAVFDAVKRDSKASEYLAASYALQSLGDNEHLPAARVAYRVRTMREALSNAGYNLETPNNCAREGKLTWESPSDSSENWYETADEVILSAWKDASEQVLQLTNATLAQWQKLSLAQQAEWVEKLTDDEYPKSLS